MDLETGENDKGKVAILFGNLKGNLGDFAILQAMVSQVERVFPGRHIVVYSHPLVGVDEGRLAEFQRQSPEISIVRSAYSKEIRWYQRALMSSILRRKTQARLIKAFASDAASSVSHFRTYEAVFFAGGDQWSGRELGVSMFGTLSAIYQQNKNIYAFPFSLKSSLLGLYSQRTLQEYFAMLQQPLIVRDSLTKRIMDELGVSSVLGVDCVYSLRSRSAGIRPAERRNALRTLFVVKGQEKNLSTVLEHLLKDGSEIELLTTCKQEDHKIYQSLSERFGLTYHTPNSWEEIIAEFKASSLVVTNRLHGLILGSLAEAPLLPVSDRKKSLAFARDAEMPHAAPTVMDVSHSLLEITKADRTVVLQKMKHYADFSLTKPYCPVE